MIQRLFRLPSLPWRVELGDILQLAVPLAVSQVGLILMNITDSIMTGQISAESLAAGSLAGTVAFTFIIFAQGLLMAMQPILSQLRGAQNFQPIARTLAAAFALALACSLPIILILLQIDRLLILAGTEAKLARMALDYEYGFVWGVPAALWQVTCRYYLSAMERPRIILVTTLLACLGNLAMNWVLIFGHLGSPAFGLRGSAYATALSCFGMAVTMTIYARRAHLLPKGLLAVTLAELRQSLVEILKIGWPIACINVAEMGLFSVSTVLMSRFGPAPLAAHQICLGISTLTFMVPMATGQASTVRVGFHIGAGQPHLARRSGFISLGLGIGFMCFTALTLNILARPIIRLYIDPQDPQLDEVIAIGGQLIALAALFQVFDGAQTVASGALRGLKDTRAALVAATTGYWGLGLPLGIVLAFPLGLGPAGLWWGFVGGLAMVAALLNWRFNRLSARLAASSAAN